MGVTNLWQILETVQEHTTLSSLGGQTLAVDLSIWVCETQCVKQMQGIVSKPFLRNLFFRISHLLQLGVRLVFVIEGTAPDLKWDVMMKRQQSRFPQNKATGVKTKNMRGGRGNFNACLRECCEMLDYLGIPYIQSTGEAEAMCAALNAAGLVDGCLTNDGDAFLYGARTVYRNFTMNTKDPHVECYKMSSIEQELHLTREKLVAMALLLGCDYVPKGVPGVGMDKALKLMKSLAGKDVLHRFGQWQHMSDSDCVDQIEVTVKRKAYLVSDFPPKKVIKEFMELDFKCPNKVQDWKRPSISKLKTFSLNKLEWPVEYTLEKILPLVTLWDMKDITSSITPCSGLHLEPRRIIKGRVKQGVNCYEVQWIKPVHDTVSTEDQYRTIEEQSLVKKCFPDMVATFEAELETKKTKSKVSQQTKMVMYAKGDRVLCSWLRGIWWPGFIAEVLEDKDVCHYKVAFWNEEEMIICPANNLMEFKTDSDLITSSLKKLKRQSVLKQKYLEDIQIAKQPTESRESQPEELLNHSDGPEILLSQTSRPEEPLVQTGRPEEPLIQSAGSLPPSEEPPFQPEEMLTQSNRPDESLAQSSRPEESIIRTDRPEESLTQSSRTEESLAQSNITEESLTHSNRTEESLTQSNRTEESLTQFSRTDESLTQSNITEESLTHSNRTEESLTQFSRTEESLTQSNISVESLTQSSITEDSLAQFSRTEESLAQSNITEESLTLSNRTKESLTQSNRTEESLTQFSRTDESLTQFSRTEESLTQSNISVESLTQSSKTEESLTQSSRSEELIIRTDRPEESLAQSSIIEESLTQSNITEESLAHSNRTVESLTQSNRTDESLTQSSRTEESLTRSNITVESLTQSSRTEESLTQSNRPKEPLTHTSRPEESLILTGRPEESFTQSVGQCHLSEELVSCSTKGVKESYLPTLSNKQQELIQSLEFSSEESDLEDSGSEYVQSDEKESSESEVNVSSSTSVRGMKRKDYSEDEFNIISSTSYPWGDYRKSINQAVQDIDIESERVENSDSDMSDEIPYLQPLGPLCNTSAIDSDSDIDIVEEEIIRDINYPSIFIRKIVSSKTTKCGKVKKSERVYNTRHFCPFCHKSVSSFMQHLSSKIHDEEPEVVKLKTLVGKERKWKIAILRNRGDNFQNGKAISRKNGEIVLARRIGPNEHLDISKYGPCPLCLEWLKLDVLFRHQSNCPEGSTHSEQSGSFFMSKGSIMVQSSLIAGRLTECASTMLVNEVFSIMLDDRVGHVAKHDNLIIALGNHWFQRNVGNRLMRKHYVSAVMRLTSRLLLQIRNLTTSEKNMEDYLQPRYFSDVALAALRVAKQDDDNNDSLGAPSNAIKLGYHVKRLCNLKLGMAIRQGNDDKRKASKDFLRLMDLEWSSKLARVNLQERKRNRKVELPLPSDVKKLAQYLKSEIVSFDTSNVTYENFRKASILAEAALITYNRRRPGEVQAMRLIEYRNRKTGIDDGVGEEIVKSLTEFERKLIEDQDVVEIRGKCGKCVPVIIQKHVRGIMEYLCNQSTRNAAGIPSSAIYIFATNRAGVVRGCDSLQFVTQRAGLQFPERIGGTNMRRLMATLCQALDVTPQQQKWIVDHMGHTLDVHDIHYRCTSDIIERGDIAKLLLLMDMKQVGYFKNKKLEEISLEELVDEPAETQGHDVPDQSPLLPLVDTPQTEEEYIPNLLEEEQEEEEILFGRRKKNKKEIHDYHVDEIEVLTKELEDCTVTEMTSQSMTKEGEITTTCPSLSVQKLKSCSYDKTGSPSFSGRRDELLCVQKAGNCIIVSPIQRLQKMMKEVSRQKIFEKNLNFSSSDEDEEYLPLSQRLKLRLNEGSCVNSDTNVRPLGQLSKVTTLCTPEKRDGCQGASKLKVETNYLHLSKNVCEESVIETAKFEVENKEPEDRVFVKAISEGISVAMLNAEMKDKNERDSDLENHFNDDHILIDGAFPSAKVTKSRELMVKSKCENKTVLNKTDFPHAYTLNFSAVKTPNVTMKQTHKHMLESLSVSTPDTLSKDLFNSFYENMSNLSPYLSGQILNSPSFFEYNGPQNVVKAFRNFTPGNQKVENLYLNVSEKEVSLNMTDKCVDNFGDFNIQTSLLNNMSQVDASDVDFSNWSPLSSKNCVGDVGSSEGNAAHFSPSACDYFRTPDQSDFELSNKYDETAPQNSAVLSDPEISDSLGNFKTDNMITIDLSGTHISDSSLTSSGRNSASPINQKELLKPQKDLGLSCTELEACNTFSTATNDSHIQESMSEINCFKAEYLNHKVKRQHSSTSDSHSFLIDQTRNLSDHYVDRTNSGDMNVSTEEIMISSQQSHNKGLEFSVSKQRGALQSISNCVPDKHNSIQKLKQNHNRSVTSCCIGKENSAEEKDTTVVCRSPVSLFDRLKQKMKSDGDSSILLKIKRGQESLKPL